MGMDGAARRRQIVAALEGSARPLSGKELSDMLRVSRQVIVQDIALLRHEGHEIVGLHTGYVLREERKGLRRLIKCHHTDDQLEDEMDIVVDAGATMEDVIVNHRTYGVISAPLGARSRRDVQDSWRASIQGYLRPSCFSQMATTSTISARLPRISSMRSRRS
jgi:uncharacterized protein